MIEQISGEIEDFNTDVKIVQGLGYNQKQIVDRCYNYYYSNFESGEFDSDGFKKYFFNINRNSCNVSTKAIDFDTKDIILQTASGGNYFKTWFFERDLKFWFKTVKFGAVLNRILEELPKFGSSVIKLIGNQIYFVDLKNFMPEPSADSLVKANYIIETHNFNLLEFKRKAKEKEWEEEGVKKLIGALEPNDFVRVFERYGLDEEGDLSMIIIGEARKKDDEKFDKKITDGIELDRQKIDRIPYWEFHWEKIPGRWLGVGRVEILFDPQIRMNEIANLKVKSSYWTSLRIHQTRDEGFQRNLLANTKTGDVLHVKSEITPIATEERNLHSYNQEEIRWLGNRDEMTVVHDVIRGERLPAGTPLGSARIAAGMAGAYFDIIRENVAMSVKELLIEGIIPQFQEQATEEHILNLTGSENELAKLDQLIINLTFKKQLNEIVKGGHFPPKEFFTILRKGIVHYLGNKKTREIKIPKDFYANLKYKIDIIITGEQKDIRMEAASYFAALQAMTADPTLLTDPVKKRFFYKWMEKGGLSPAELEIDIIVPEEVPPAAGRAGGGVARPVIAGQPVGGIVEQRI